MTAERLPERGASNQANSLTIVLSTTNGTHVFTDDKAASQFLMENQPAIRSVCQVPLDNGLRKRPA